MRKTQYNQKKPEITFNYETVVMGKSTDFKDEDYESLIARDVRLQRLIESLPIIKGKMLDIGCGGGTITNCLAYKYPKMKLYGCDISKTAIRLARKSQPARAIFFVISDDKFPYKSNYFDACICFDVLEHVPDPEKFIAETKRVLKRGGVIFFAVPCEGQPWSLTWILQKLTIGDKLTYKHVGHIHPEFNHAYIEGLFKKHGFRISSVTYSEHFLTQCVRFIRFILPKELLELFLGTRRAEAYYDRSIVRSQHIREHCGAVMAIRDLWLRMAPPFDFIEHVEATLGKHNEFTAWKMLLLAKKNA